MRNKLPSQKFYLLCPNCLTLLKEWREDYRCIDIEFLEINEDTGNINIVDTDYDDCHFVGSSCPECGEDFNMSAPYFRIAIKLKTLEIIPIGSHWLSNKHVLEKYRNKILDQFMQLTGHDIIEV